MNKYIEMWKECNIYTKQLIVVFVLPAVIIAPTVVIWTVVMQPMFLFLWIPVFYAFFLAIMVQRP